MRIFDAMKKFFIAFALLAGASLLTGCFPDNTDDSATDIIVTSGALVINKGNAPQGIDGSLTHLDFGNSSSREISGLSQYGTFSDIMVYGGKAYVVCPDECSILVLDRKSFQPIKTVPTTIMIGSEYPDTPSRLAAYADKVYVSLESGYVCAIDTLSFAIRATYRVGSYPEGMCIGSKNDIPYLYVANSDAGDGNGSISTVELSTGTVKELRNEKIRYPRELAVAGEDIYLLDWGVFDENGTQKDAGVYRINESSVYQIIPDATYMSTGGYTILTANAPQGGTGISYSSYNILTSTRIDFPISGDGPKIISPTSVSIDPNTGYVMITSRNPDPDTGEPAYDLPGFANLYKPSGEFAMTFSVGVEPGDVAFLYQVEKFK